jgi:hypothetical protein
VGLIGKILSFTRVMRNNAKISDVKVNPGGNPNLTAEHFADAGDDSNPLPGDYALISGVNGTGRGAAVGYVDVKNLQKSLAGEKRIYARDAQGVQKAELWLKSTGDTTLNNDMSSIALTAAGDVMITCPIAQFNVLVDGTISGQNGAGIFQLLPNGDFVVNGFVIAASGAATGPGSISSPSVEATSSLKAAGKEIAGHLHPAGSPPGNTGPNI